jgi:hypothetical protein
VNLQFPATNPSFTPRLARHWSTPALPLRHQPGEVRTCFQRQSCKPFSEAETPFLSEVCCLCGSDRRSIERICIARPHFSLIAFHTSPCHSCLPLLPVFFS